MPANDKVTNRVRHIWLIAVLLFIVVVVGYAARETGNWREGERILVPEPLSPVRFQIPQTATCLRYLMMY